MAAIYHLNLRHLEAIIAIARVGSISGAALAVNLSQPTLTQGVAKIERRLGLRLFDRLSDGTAVTAAGKLLLARIERAICHLADGSDRLRRAARLPPLTHVERRLTMVQLRALTAVAAAGSYVLAARLTGLSQPSIHRGVADLERAIGLPLVQRIGRTIGLAPLAGDFVRAINLFEVELQAGLDELSSLQAHGGGRVVIGAMPLARARLVPRALARFCLRYPEATARVIDGPYEELLVGLRNGDIDLLVGALRDPLPSADIQQQALFEDRLMIVARAGHPLAVTPHPTAATLGRFPWVLAPAGTPLRDRWERFFAADGVPAPAPRVECSSVLTVRALLLEGDWLTLLSPHQFRLEKEAGLLVAIGGPLPGTARPIGLTTRADWLPTPLQSAFVDTLKGSLRESGHDSGLLEIQ